MSPASFFVIFVTLVANTFVASVAFAQQSDIIAEIRVHGNHTTPDVDVLALANLKVGDPADAAHLEAAEASLISSGRFAGVEVRRRYRSIANPSEILIILLVDDFAVVTKNDLTPGPLRRLRFASMWMPVLNYADGFGFTYGARVSFVDALGRRSRVSVPLTWGGERRAALELERSLDGPVTRVRGGVFTYRRVNPHFNTADTRLEARVEAERAWTGWLRAGTTARVALVDFAGEGSRHSAIGVNAAIDTRVDPSFPRNAVYVRVGWERLMFDDFRLKPPLDSARGGPVPAEGPEESGGAGRWLVDLRGYAGIGGSAVLALRGYLARADAPLPSSEQMLIGGGDTVRGYRAGHHAGDSIAAVSLEARMPLNPPLSAGRFGVKGFVDAGAAWVTGARMADQRFDRGIGSGIYFGIAALLTDLDVAWPEHGKPRVHFGLGVSF